MIESGQIQTPCGIIIENLSRFSRQHPKKVLDNIERFMNRDVFIHTIQDNNTYSRQDFEGGSIFPLITLLIKAQAYYEFIQTHALTVERGKDFVRDKFINGETKGIYKRNVPFHVDIQKDDEGQEFYGLKNDHAELIKRVFLERLMGIGTSEISNRLNEEKLFKLKKHKVPFTAEWVTKTLKSRCYLGFIQFNKIKEVEEDGRIVKKNIPLTDKNGKNIERRR